jgi:hypothetical protein
MDRTITGDQDTDLYNKLYNIELYRVDWIYILTHVHHDLRIYMIYIYSMQDLCMASFDL